MKTMIGFSIDAAVQERLNEFRNKSEVVNKLLKRYLCEGDDILLQIAELQTQIDVLKKRYEDIQYKLSHLPEDQVKRLKESKKIIDEHVESPGMPTKADLIITHHKGFNRDFEEFYSLKQFKKLLDSVV